MFDISHLFLNTERINKRKATKAMKEFYRYCKQVEPEVIFVNGPTELKEKIDPEDEGFSFFDHQDIAHFVNRRGVSKIGRIKHRVQSLFWEFRRPNKMDTKFVGSSALLMPEDYECNGDSKWEKLATAVWNESYVTINFKNKSFIVERPMVALHNGRGFHCADGPSLIFRDGSEFHFWNGEEITEQQLLHPENVTLEEIHNHSNKHIMIAMVGVDNYLEMVKAWKPDVKGKFQKFGDFPQMFVAGEEDKKEWNKKSQASLYKEKPYKIKFSKSTVNGKYGTILKEGKSSIYHFEGSHYKTDWTSYEQGKLLFEENDRDLLKSLHIEKTLSMCSFNLELGFMDKYFYLSTPRIKRCISPSCHKDAAPAWFRTKMFLGENVIYKTDKYVIRFKNGKLRWVGDLPKQSSFVGNENLPIVYFDLHLASDSWEGLLEKWARFAFENIAMY